MTGRGGPDLGRQITLSIQGDVGIGALHRAASWIASQLLGRTASGSRIAVWTSAGTLDGLRAVADGTVDIALVTPAAAGRLAVDGRGPFDGRPLSGLRALGTLPQLDRLLFAVRADLGIRSFADLREAKPALRIATPAEDDPNLVGWLARRVLEASGVPPDLLESWGGSFVNFDEFPPHSFERNFPGKFPELVASGRADAVAHEAMMLPQWQQAVADPGLVFLPLEPAAAETLERELGWPAAELPADYFAGQPAVPVPDFADFLVLCRDDLPDDLAQLIAWCLSETRAVFEAQYRHIPVRHSTVTYPLDPAQMSRTSIPLHPGAARHWTDRPDEVDS